MDTKASILRLVSQKKRIRTSDVVRKTGISRQAAAKHLRELVGMRQLSKEGSTHQACYFPFDPQRTATSGQASASILCSTKRLEEDRVWDTLARKAQLSQHLSPQAFKITQYAFTEMLNNAIDHSRSKKVRAELKVGQGDMIFRVLDRGIGVFENVRKQFKLKDHFEAAEHLLKGKQTTMPRRHSGQGIFFTSRLADHFELTSAAVKLDVNNTLGDIGLIDVKNTRGTEVSFTIKQRSRKDLKALFDAYTDSDLVFDKTEIRIRLSKTSPGGYVSRSEARRLLFGLEKFKRIVIDFRKVRGIGQGFADEIFRVFHKQHPSIQLEPVSMAPSVAFFVKRALQEDKTRS
jgi:anti-sigma regulatory factor (Ser/Thr protein kinase)